MMRVNECTILHMEVQMHTASTRRWTLQLAVSINIGAADWWLCEPVLSCEVLD